MQLKKSLKLCRKKCRKCNEINHVPIYLRFISLFHTINPKGLWGGGVILLYLRFLAKTVKPSFTIYNASFTITSLYILCVFTKRSFKKVTNFWF